MISRSRLAMPAGSGLLSLEKSQRAVHVFLIQVATLQVSFARARIERCAPVQHSVVVVGDEVSGLKSQLEPILRIAQHAPERGEGLVHRLHQLLLPNHYTPQPVVEPDPRPPPLAVHFDPRRARAGIAGMVVKAVLHFVGAAPDERLLVRGTAT